MNLWNLAAPITDASAISAELGRQMPAAEEGTRLRIGEATTTGNAWRGP
jgi:hypothetical protein